MLLDVEDILNFTSSKHLNCVSPCCTCVFPSSRSWWMCMLSTHSLCVGRAGLPAARKGRLVSAACSAVSSAWGTSAWLLRPSQLLSPRCRPLPSQNPHPSGQKQGLRTWRHHTHKLPHAPRILGIKSWKQGAKRWGQRRSAGDTIQPLSWEVQGQIACSWQGLF